MKTKHLLIALLPTFLFSCSNYEPKEKVIALEVKTDSLQTIIQERDSLINEVMDAFYQIEKDLAYIKQERNIISETSDNMELSENRKNKVVQDVQELAILLDQNKKELSALNKKLKNSGVKIKNLEVRLNELTASLEERNNDLAVLKTELEQKNFELAELNTQITTLQTEKLEQEEVITNQLLAIDELNTGYYTVGTKKDLTEKGVIVNEGGFLGLGKTAKLNTSASPESFSAFDIRDTKQFGIDYADVELISEHPDGSYKFIENEDEVAALEITDTEEFYKFSKYVVLAVK